ncbi:MAG: DMT family transporter [Peptoniphilus sp.]|nr:DMT family transporter [Peptoniphilus sp.]MDD7363566.1 DMT family transporter [Bacillota bacterium]MDY6044680.1 DMT family transporter [Peptoniphilus sp.]
MLKGFLLIALCTLLWAFNGNIGGYIFEYKNLTPEMLVSIRLIGVGVFLSVLDLYRSGRYAFRVVRKRENIPNFLLYSLGGILCMQFGYFSAISYSNAPTATLLQYSGLFFIIAAVAIMTKTPPKFRVYPALALCAVGLFYLVTGGDVHSLQISREALMWGLVSAFGFTNFNLAPTGLSKTYRSMEIIGPSMLLGGLTLLILTRPDFSAATWDATSIAGVLFCTIGGTLIPFWAFLEGARLTGPTLSSVFSLSEAVFSTLVAVLVYGLAFSRTDLLGMVLILISVLILSYPEKKKPKKQKPLRERVKEDL